MLNQLKTVLLLGVLTGLLIAFGAMIGKGAAIVAAVAAIALNLGAYFYSDRLVLRMHRAEELSLQQAPRLHSMVEELAARAGIPKPRLYRMPSHQPNAFATGRNPEKGVVAVTDGIVELLDERELRGVLAHEIAHIRNRDILVATIAAAVAGAITWIANMLQFSAIFGGGDEDAPSPLAALALAFIAPIAAMLVQMAISRSREFLADEKGAEIAGDPIGLARALEKLERGAMRIPAAAQPATASLFIVNPFSGRRGMTQLFSTHPSTQARIERLYALAGNPRGLAA